MLYDGDPIGGGDVRLVAPRRAAVRAAETGEEDDQGPWARWFAAGERDPAIVYFSIERRGRLVGEVFLHDIDRAAREAMVGYRLFAAADRGHGTGGAALELLVGWVVARGDVDRLVVIARAGNVASRRIAERTGFRVVGPAREDPGRVVHECWPRQLHCDADQAVHNAHEWFEHNSGWAPPDPDTLAEWLADGVCRSPDHCLVDPDGWCRHGLASWALVLADVDQRGV